MAVTSNALIMWAKAEPFSYGTLSVSPHPRLSLNNIKKIIPYTKSKDTSGFPHLSYSVWKHIACSKLQLSEDLAWLYFSMCHCLSHDVTPAEHDDYDAYLSSTPDGKGCGEKINFCDLNTVEDGVDILSLDEHGHSLFVQNHLHDILALLIEPDSYAGSDSGITTTAIQALDFIIGASTASHRECLPFHKLCLLQSYQAKSGYSKLTQTFSIRTLHHWITSHLTHNPFGISACIASGKRLSWPISMTFNDGDKQTTTKRGKVATNTHIVPKEMTKGNKIIIISQVSRQTLARSCPTLENASIKIHRCHYSFIYLLSPLRSVTIEKCRHTTVVLGPVETSVVVSYCEQVTVVAPTRYITLNSCTLCVLHLITPNYPNLLGGNDTILLAPYHTWYPTLGQHMAEVGISAAYQFWHQPLCIGPDHNSDTPVWQHLPISEFFIFSIPFQMDGPTQSIPGGLPPSYQKAINERQTEINDWQTLVRDSCLTRPQRKELQSLVESRFHIWLSEMGHKSELDSLVVPLQQMTKR